MESRDVKEITVDVTIGGKTVHPTKVALYESINSIPYATVDYVPDTDIEAEEGSIPMGSEKVFKVMGELQEKMFDVQEADSDILLADAFGGSIYFKGRANAPMYSLQAGAVSFMQKIDHEMSLVNVFNAASYVPEKANINFSQHIQDKNVPEIFLDILQTLMDRFPTVLAKSKTTTLSKKAMEVQHNLNKDTRVKGVIEEIMKVSCENEEDGGGPHFAWEKLAKWMDAADHGKTLCQRLADIIMANTGGFFGNLLQFANDFQELYIPDFESAGYLKSRRLIFNGIKEMKVDIISCSLSTGTMGWFPSRAVGIESPEALANDKNVNFSKQNNDYITYPELPDDITKVPSIIPCPAPPWLPRLWARFRSQKVPCGTPVNQRDIMEVSQTEKVIKEGVKDTDKKQEDSRTNMVYEWAKNAYIWEVLQSSSCAITTELKLDFKVGVRYRVLNTEGKPLFSGLLTSIAHCISVDGEKGKATTDLSFSHVVFLSATIPNVK